MAEATDLAARHDQYLYAPQMRRERLTTAFAYDAHFETAGFTLLR